MEEDLAVAAPMIKICGLTHLDDVLLARDLGAWAVGFVFAPSPRRLTPAAARGIVEGLSGGDRPRGGAAVPHTVGVFGDIPAEEIASVVGQVGLSAVQLHGAEGPGGDAVRAALADLGRPVLVIQAVPVDPEDTDVAALRQAVVEARGAADIVLLDTRLRGRFGGTGAALPWSLVAAAAEGEVLIAGGISPDNIEQAVRESRAWGVDVSSGVERSPGVKDARLMRQLFARAGVLRGPAPGRGRGDMPGRGTEDIPGAASGERRQRGRCS